MTWLVGTSAHADKGGITPVKFHGLPGRLTVWAEFHRRPDHSKSLTVNAKITVNQIFISHSLRGISFQYQKRKNLQILICMNLYTWCCFMNKCDMSLCCFLILLYSLMRIRFTHYFMMRNPFYAKSPALANLKLDRYGNAEMRMSW